VTRGRGTAVDGPDVSSVAREGRLRVGILSEVPRVLEALGADPEPVFAAAGLDLHLLENPDSDIPFAAAGRLMQACVSATRCEHFGLLAGQGLALQSLGIVGQLMQTAPTLEFALWDLALSQARLVEGAVFYLRRMGDYSALCFAIHQPRMAAVSQISDKAIALAFNAIRELAGPVVIEVNLGHAQPRDISPFRRFFGVPLRYDSEESGVVLPSRALSLPVMSVNPVLRNQLHDTIWAHPALSRPDICAQVVRTLRPRIISGQVSIEEVAASLSLHPRSLLRKLKAQGTTFRDLLNETRFEVACQLLSGTRLSITEIGLVFGYSDTAVFTRSFERQCGLSPSGWRARQSEVAVQRPTASPSSISIGQSASARALRPAMALAASGSMRKLRSRSRSPDRSPRNPPGWHRLPPPRGQER
jgi:AraC-like DNA-binding protein